MKRRRLKTNHHELSINDTVLEYGCVHVFPPTCSFPLKTIWRSLGCTTTSYHIQNGWWTLTTRGVPWHPNITCHQLWGIDNGPLNSITRMPGKVRPGQAAKRTLGVVVWMDGRKGRKDRWMNGGMTQFILVILHLWMDRSKERWMNRRMPHPMLSHVPLQPTPLDVHYS